jgi:Fe-S-cluster containining protein
MLELALTPYDVLRLRQGTGLPSGELLEKYILTEHDPAEPFPKFYLTMIDDGRASCAFVSKNGCTVYEHRPSACRAYPLGRAVIRNRENAIEEFHVLIKEQHCLGFAENHTQNLVKYTSEQGLLEYNRFNDAVAFILQHDSIRNGFLPSKKQVELFILALYDIDTFRKKLLSDYFDSVTLAESEKRDLEDDEKLLLFSINFLMKELYPSQHTFPDHA